MNNTVAISDFARSSVPGSRPKVRREECFVSALGSTSPAKAAASASAAGILEGVDDSADMMAFQGNSSAAALRAAKARFNTSRKCSGKAKSFEEGNESKMPKALAAAVAANPGKFFKLLVENNGTQQSLLVG